MDKNEDIKGEYKKSEIAIMQLKTAIQLYNQGDYVSALTLSGVAAHINATLLKLPFF